MTYRIQVGIYRFYAAERTAAQVREDLRELAAGKGVVVIHDGAMRSVTPTADWHVFDSYGKDVTDQFKEPT
jgi:hypothetical protein